MGFEVELEKLERLYEGIADMQTMIHASLAKRQSKAAEGSPAELEERNVDLGRHARNAHLYGAFTFLVADDHLSALARIAGHPVSSLAPATCARAVIESSALCSWLCDPKIGVYQRVARCYAYRYEGLCQQGKLKGEREPKIDEQVDAMEAEALSLGYNQITKGGKRAGVGVRMPATTELIRRSLDGPSGYEFANAYRFFSGIAHGHFYAVSQFGFRAGDNPDPFAPESVLTKHADPAALAISGVNSVLAYTLAIGRLSRLFGWEDVMPLVERSYDQMGLRSIFGAPC